VTKYSSSIYLNLGKNFNPNYFLTSGNYTRKTFIKKFQSKIDCLNIGSDKFTKNFPLDLNSKNILVLPEGFNSETIKMIEFTLEAAKKYQDKRFIFRFHPMINKFNFIRKYFGTKLKIPKNIIFSNKSFEEDLKNSKYVLYRGSAAAIQALGANKIVIYMEFNNEINIDPLYMLKKKFYVKKTSQLDKIFKDKKIVQKNAKNIRFTKEYFGEPNFFPLLKYLN
jgi:hypothetical protein